MRSLIDAEAEAREYEHALDHITECGTACSGCLDLARSALDGVNRQNFTESVRAERPTGVRLLGMLTFCASVAWCAAIGLVVFVRRVVEEGPW